MLAVDINHAPRPTLGRVFGTEFARLVRKFLRMDPADRIKVSDMLDQCARRLGVIRRDSRQVLHPVCQPGCAPIRDHPALAPQHHTLLVACCCVCSAIITDLADAVPCIGCRRPVHRECTSRDDPGGCCLLCAPPPFRIRTPSYGDRRTGSYDAAAGGARGTHWWHSGF